MAGETALCHSHIASEPIIRKADTMESMANLITGHDARAMAATRVKNGFMETIQTAITTAFRMLNAITSGASTATATTANMIRAARAIPEKTGPSTFFHS